MGLDGALPRLHLSSRLLHLPATPSPYALLHLNLSSRLLTSPPAPWYGRPTVRHDQADWKAGARTQNVGWLERGIAGQFIRQKKANAMCSTMSGSPNFHVLIQPPCHTNWWLRILLKWPEKGAMAWIDKKLRHTLKRRAESCWALKHVSFPLDPNTPTAVVQLRQCSHDGLRWVNFVPQIFMLTWLLLFV